MTYSHTDQTEMNEQIQSCSFIRMSYFIYKDFRVMSFNLKEIFCLPVLTKIGSVLELTRLQLHF